MNRIFRIIWNRARQCLVVVAESARTKGQSTGSSTVTEKSRLSHWDLALAALLLEALNPPMALAQTVIRPDGRTQTAVSNAGAVYNVSTGTVSGSNAFNSFSAFSVGAGNVVNLVVPSSAINLINIVRDQRTDVYGILNAIKDGKIGGNVWFANPRGFVVGASGVVNVGSLAVVTPTQRFVDDFFSAPGTPDQASVTQLIAGTAPRNNEGLISILGRINALEGISLSAGAINVSGSIYSGARFVGSAPDFSDVVNANGLTAASGVVVKDGRIQIVADGDVTVSGTIAAPGGAGVRGGEISIRAGGDVELGAGTIVSARGNGAGSAGGAVNIWADHNAALRSGALVDASAGSSGDGGAIELSAGNQVTLAGGQFAASGNGGRAGSVLVDPNTIEVVASNQIYGGTNYSLIASRSINVGDGVIVSTRNIGSSADYEGAVSAGNSGDITLAAPSITLGIGSKLLAQVESGSAYQGGLVSLTATQVNGGDAQISLTKAVVKGQSVTLQASSMLSDSSPTLAVLSGATSSDASARIVIDSSELVASGGALMLTSTATVNVSASGAIPLAVLRSTTTASVDVRGSSKLVTTAGDALLSAHSTVTTNATPTSPLASQAGDAMVATSRVNSTATVHLGDTTSANIAGDLGLSATNTVSTTQLADASAGGSSAAGAALALSIIRSETTAKVDGQASIDSVNGLHLSALSSNTVIATAKAAAKGAQQDSSGSSQSSQALTSYKDDTNSGDSGSTGGGVKVAGAIAISDLQSTTEASLGSSQAATVKGAASLISRTTNGATVGADGSATGGNTGVGAAVALNLAKSSNEALVGQNVSARSLSATAAMNPAGVLNRFTTTAVSGAGASNVGIAGSIAVNALDLSSNATLGSGFGLTMLPGGSGTLVLTAENLTSSSASSTPASGAAAGSKVGIGAAVAVNVVSNRASALIDDSATVSGASDVTVQASGQDTVSTTAEAGAAGGLAITPVAAINVINNTVSARIGSGAALTATGDLRVEAVQAASATASAKGSSQGSAAVGAAVAVALVDDQVSATTARSIDTSGASSGKGAVRFVAHGASASSASAIASASGGKSDDNKSSDDGDLDSKVGKQLSAGTNVQQKNGVGDNAEQSKTSSEAAGKPSASSSQGKVSVAAAVSVNLQTSSATATVPDAAHAGDLVIKARGAVTLSSSNNTDGAASADGSTVGSTAAIGIGAAVAINRVKSVNEASIGQNARVSGSSLTLSATMTDVKGDGTDFSNTLGAQAKSGAGSDKVGLAGSLALNLVDTSSQALIKGGALVDAGHGAVELTADDRTDSTAKALPADDGGASGGKVGIGASVAVNIVANRSIAEIEDAATLNQPGSVSLGATGKFAATTEAEAGAAGGVAITPAVALALINNTSRARLGSGAVLSSPGAVTIEADQASSTTTVAKGSAQGEKAAIGAAVGIVSLNDIASASIERNIDTATGAVTVSARASSASTNAATASAVGGKSTDDAGQTDAATGKAKEDATVDDKVGNQLSFGEDTQKSSKVGDGSQQSATSSADSNKTSASSDEGKVAVAAAVAVNIVSASATATIASGVTVRTTGSLALSASGNTDSSATSDGSAVGSTAKVGIGAAVSVNKVDSHNEASIGENAQVAAKGVTLEATMTDVTGHGSDLTNTADAQAASGAGGSKVGIAASLALNVLNTSAKALINGGAQVDAGSGDLEATALDRSNSIAKAVPTTTGGATGGKVGIGASVALNLITAHTQAQILPNATITNANKLTLGATSVGDSDAEATAGATGGKLAFDAAVAATTLNQTTDASIGAGSKISTADALAVTATSSGTNSATSTGTARSGSASVGASVGVIVSHSDTSATIDRDMDASGTFTLSATATRVHDAVATASAGGSQSDQTYSSNQTQANRSKSSSTLASSQDSETNQGTQGGGKVNVAAAVGVVSIDDNARAAVTGGRTILSGAGKAMKIEATNVASFSARGAGDAVDPNAKVGVAVGVGLVISKDDTSAALADNTRVTRAGALAVQATSKQNTDALHANKLTAEGLAGAGGSKVGVAGALAVVDSHTTTEATIGSHSEIKPSGALVIDAENTATLSAKAWAGAFGQIGVGAAVATVISNNRYQASLGSDSTVTAASVDITARNNRFSASPFALDLSALKLGAMSESEIRSAFSGIAGQLTSGKLLGGGNYYTEAAAGSAGDKVAVSGSFAVNVFSDFTDASIGANSTLNASTGAVNVTASNDTVARSVAGSLAVGGNVGVGISSATVASTSETTSHVDAGVSITHSSAIKLVATNAQDIELIGVAGGVSSSVAVGGVANIITLDNAVKAYVADSTATMLTSTGEFSAIASNTVTGMNVASGLAASGSVGVGIAAVVNTLGTDSTHQFVTRAYVGDGVSINAGAQTLVSATASEALTTFAIAGAASGSVSVGGAAVVNVLNTDTEAYVGDGAKINKGQALVSQSASVAAQDTTALFDVVVGVGAGGSVGIGASGDVAVIDKSTQAHVGQGAWVESALDVKAQAASSEDFRSLVIGLGVGGSVGGAGSASVYSLSGSTLGYIDDGAHVAATGNVVVGADSATRFGMIAGAAGVGGSAGLGASAVVAVVDKTTHAYLGDRVDVTALGNSGFTVLAPDGTFATTFGNYGAGATFQPSSSTSDVQTGAGDLLSKQVTTTQNTSAINGVAVTATNRDTIESIAAAGAAAGAAAIGVSGDVYVVGNNTSAYVGNGAQINQGAGTAGAHQSVRIAAGNDFYHLGLAGSAAGAGAVGIGIGAEVSVVSNATSAYVGYLDGSYSGPVARLKAAQDVSLTAWGREDLVTVAASAGVAGTVAAAGSASVVSVNDHTLAELYQGTHVDANGNVAISARDETNTAMIAGSLAVGIGAAGIGGAVGVTLINKDTEALIGNGATVDARGLGSSDLSSYSGDNFDSTTPMRGLLVQADSAENLFTVSVAGGAGLFAGLAGAISVQTVKSSTIAAIGHHALINQSGGATPAATQDVNVTARNRSGMRVIDVGVGLGFVGVAGSVDIGTIQNNTTASIGNGSVVGAARDVAVNALSSKHIDTLVGSAAGGVVGLAGSVAVYSIGSGLSQDGKDQLDTSGGNLGSYAGAQGQDGTVDSVLQGSGDSRVRATSSRAQAGRSSVDAVSSLANSNATGTTASIIGATVTAGRDVRVNSKETLGVTLNTGAIAGGLVGLGAGVGVVSLQDQNQASLVGGIIQAGRDLRIAARTDNTETVNATAGSGGIVAAQASFAMISDQTLTAAFIGDATQIVNAEEVAVSAIDQRTASATAQGAAVGAYTAGASVAESSVGGSTLAYLGSNVEIGQAAGTVGSLAVTADATDTAQSSATAAAAGVAAAVSGAVAGADASSNVRASIGSQAKIEVSSDIALLAQATSRAVAQSIGVNLSAGIAAGVSTADATVAPTVTAFVGADSVIAARSLSVVAQTLLPSSGLAAQASTIAGAGGALVGASASASHATNTPMVTAYIDSRSSLLIADSLSFGPSNVISGSQISFGSAVHHYRNGDAIVYHASGGVAITGLQDGQTYYVIVVDAHTIRLASNQVNANAKVALAVSANPTGATVQGVSFTGVVSGAHSDSNVTVVIDSSLNDISFSVEHGLSEDQAVTYHAGASPIAGLQDGMIYFVHVVGNKTIQLRDSLTRAAPVALSIALKAPVISGQLAASTATLQLGGAVINADGTITFTNPSDGNGGFLELNLVDGTRVVFSKLTGAGVSGLSDGTTYYIKNVSSNPTSTTLRLMADNTVAIKVGVPGSTVSAGTVTGVTLYDYGSSAPAVNAPVTVVGNQLVFGSAQTFTDGETVVYTGSGISGLTSGATYTIGRIDATHFSFKSYVPDLGLVVAVTPVAGSGSVAGISLVSSDGTGASLGSGAVTVDGASKTIQFDSQNLINGSSFQTGQAVVFIGSGISGLTSNTTYYVINAGANTIKLSTSAPLTAVTLGGSGTVTLGDAAKPGALNAQVSVDPATGIMSFTTPQSFQDSQRVVYTGTSVANLTSGASYYVEVLSPTQIKLATTISRSEVSDVSSTLPSSARGVAPQFSLVDTSVSGPSITSSHAIIDQTARTITFDSALDSKPSFATGAAVTFTGSGISGLSNSTAGAQVVYYVINTDNPYVIQLASSRADALASVANTIPLTISAAVGGTASLADPNAGVTVRATTNTAQKATSTGINVGLLAVGSVSAAASSDAHTDAHLGSGVSQSGGTLAVSAQGVDNNYAESSSGSGGVIAGSAASASTTNLSSTHAYTADTDSGGTASNLHVQSFQLVAGHSAIFNSKTDSIQAALLGLSGSATANRTVSTVDADIGANTKVTSGDLLITATNTTRKDWLAGGGYNVQSGSGGLFGGAAAQSETTIINQTAIHVGSGAELTVSELADQQGRLQLSVFNDVIARDQVKLDAGGAIAVASAQSRIRNGDEDGGNQIAGDSATIEIGSKASLNALGDLTLSTRTQAVVETNVNAKTYGLAGAAEGTTLASISATDQVTVHDGAQLAAGGNINLYAGMDENGLANKLSAAARTDLWNKTVVPIETSPQADGRIWQNNKVKVGDSYHPSAPADNATLKAVADVNLRAANGTTSVVGYGEGKDLYREALAAIGSAVSQLFGGGPIDLDIKGGSVSDIVNSAVAVDGTVMAGAHHNQWLTIDALGGATASEGVTYSVTAPQSLQHNLTDQIQNLKALKTQYAANANIAGAFQAEIDFLTAKRDALGSDAKAVFINVDDILARSGNVNITGKSLLGAGSITAPGDATINITNYSADFLSINKLTIPTDNGGRITFNGVLVGTDADIKAHQSASLGAPALTLTSAASGSPAPSIVVANVNPSTGSYALKPEIHLTGDISNLRGLVDIESHGDVVAGANIDAETVKIRTDGDFVQKFIWGFDHLGGDPAAQYLNLQLAANNTVVLGTNSSYSTDVSIPTNSVSCAGGCGVIAGNNVFISAEQLNVNGLIQAGIPYKSVVFDSSTDALIAGHAPSSTRYAINTAAPGSNEIQAYYNPATGKIELDDTQIQGGFMQLYGNIFSTGQGTLRVIDGYGKINVTNNSSHDLTLPQLSVGASRIDGTLKITDTAKQLGKVVDEHGNQVSTSLTTIMTTTRDRSGNTVIHTVDNSTLGTDGLASHVDDKPATMSTGANDVTIATSSYQPLENRRYEWVYGQDLTETDNLTWRHKTSLGIQWEPSSSDVASSISPAFSTPVPLSQGSYLIAGNDDHYFEFSYARNKVGETAKSAFNTDSWKTDCWAHICVSRQYQTTQTWTTNFSDTYRYSVRADMPIAVEFMGYQTGSIFVNSSHGIQINGGIVNPSGTTTLTAGGAITQSASTATLLSGSVKLNAGTGIGAKDGVVRIDQQSGGVLDAVTGSGDVYLSQINGPLVYNRITTGSGNVNVTTDTDLLPASSSALIKGRRVDLTATSGAIGYLGVAGHADMPVLVNTGQLPGLDSAGQPTDGLNVTAAGNIYVREASKGAGETVRNQLLISADSQGGDVRIEIPDGSLLDNNPVQRVDDRTVTQLTNLWNNMHLVGASTASLASDTVTAYDSLKQREYQTYWSSLRHVRAVTDSHGITTGYVADSYDPNALYPLTAAQLDYYRNVQKMSDAQIVALQVGKTREYGAATYDANYSYHYDATADTLGLTKGASWTTEELRYAISAGALKPTASTMTRIEDPNIKGQNVTVIAGVNVGANNPRDAVTITLPVAGTSANLTDQQILALAAAEYQDITVVNGTIVIAQPEDVNVNAIARTTVQANGDVYLGSTIDLNLDHVSAGGVVRIKGREAIINAAAPGETNITGGNLVIEAGNGSIGTAAYAGAASAQPLLIDLTPGATLTARASDDLDLLSLGDINVDSVFSAKNVKLTATGSILEARNDSQLKILGDSITLTAQNGSIGSLSSALDVGVSLASGWIVASAPHDIYLNGPSGADFNLGSVIAGGNIGLSADFDMRIDGPVRTTGALGSISFGNPAGYLSMTAGAAVTSLGGNIGISSNVLTMADGASIVSATGEIALETTGDATITGISTGNGTVNAVSIASSAGRILDGGDSRLDIVATGGPDAKLTLSGREGVGTGPLDVDVLNLKASSTHGVVEVAVKNSVVIDSVAAADRVLLTAGGSISGGTVTSTGLGTSTADQGVKVIAAGGEVNLQTVTGQSEVEVSGYNGVTLGLLASSGGSVAASSALGAVVLGTTAAAQNVTLTALAGSLRADRTTAGGALIASSALGMSLGEASSGGDLTLDAGGNLEASTLSSTGGRITARSRTGNLVLGTTAAAQNVTLAALAGSLRADRTTAGGALIAWSALGMSLGEASSGGDLTLDAGGNLEASTLSSTGGRINGRSRTGSITMGTATADSVALSAAGRVGADRLNVGSNLQLAGEVIKARVYGGSGLVSGAIGGFSDGPAAMVDLTLSGAGGFAFDSFRSASASVDIPLGTLSIARTTIVDRATFTNPMTRILVDQHDRSIQRSDIQLYSKGEPFSMYLHDNSLTTNAFVIHRSPLHEDITPYGTNTSVLEQSENALSMITEVTPPSRLASETGAGQTLISFTGVPVSLECPSDAECAQ